MFSGSHLRMRSRLQRGVICSCALLCAVVCAQANAQSGVDVPDATIPLTPLGYQPAPPHILLAEGYAVGGLQYVDAHHLLFSYNARTLIKRMPDDTPDVHPQNVEAVLLEVPSGKVVARTEWRLHDHAQYLWAIGEGTFLLRLGRELRLLTPLAPGNASDPEAALHGQLLMMLPGQASVIAVSPDGRILLVESDIAKHPEEAAPVVVPPAPAAPATVLTAPAGPSFSTSPAQPAPQLEPPAVEDQTTELQFMEFDLTQQAQGVVHVKSLGNIVSPHPLSMPLVRDGYIRAQENYTDDWLLIYTRLNGGDLVLGDVVSTCQPSAAFLSNRELLVETCNGNDTALIATVITLDKQELWQHPLDNGGTEPNVRTTPSSGRFAISRVLTDSTAPTGVGMMLDESLVHMQRIDVMDIKNGALVASVAAAPAERTAQNFSLSADGRHLAVLQNDVIALYDLAPLQDFPAKKVKDKDLIFVAAADNAPAPPAAPAPVATAADPNVIDVPLNVDARRTVPTLLTPDEKQSVESKRNKTIELPPPQVPPKQPKQQPPPDQP